jgi:hypothetical protein
MVIAGLATERWPAIIAASMFFASDLAVARDRFVGHSFINKLWGQPMYFGAQWLFAWSLGT